MRKLRRPKPIYIGLPLEERIHEWVFLIDLVEPIIDECI